MDDSIHQELETGLKGQLDSYPGKQVDAVCTWVQTVTWPGNYILGLPENTAYMQGFLLNALTMKRKDDTWLLILKGVKQGRHLVVYVECATFSDCLEVGADYAQKGILSFHTDKYPPTKKRP